MAALSVARPSRSRASFHHRRVDLLSHPTVVTKATASQQQTQPRQPEPGPPGKTLHAHILEHLVALVHQRTPPEAAAASLREFLGRFEVIRKGMGCTGKDEGLRPVHLVIVRVCMSRLLEVPGCPTDLIAGLAIAFARDHLIEFGDALALVHHLNATRLLPSIASSTDHGFRAACHPHALRTLVAALLTTGVAISPNGLLSDDLLAAAEREAIDMHSSDMMHSSTVKSIRGGGNTHTATTRYTGLVEVT